MERHSFGYKLVFLFMSLIVAFIAAQLISIVALNIHWFSSASGLKLLQFIDSIIVLFVPSVVFAKQFRIGGNASYFPLSKPVDSWSWLWTILLIIVIVPFINMLTDLNSQIHLPHFMQGIENWFQSTEDKADDMTEQFLHTNTFGGLFVNILVIALTPAICEELLFRGVLQKIFSEKWGIHAGIWVAAFIFSAIHFQFFGFIPRMLLGAIFGYLLVWSGSLWLPILAHFINNFMAVLTNHFEQIGILPESIENLGTGSMWWLAMISGILSALLLMRIKYTRKK